MINKEEYLAKLNLSPAFKELDEETRQKMLKAEGEQMEEYAKLLNDENSLLTESIRATGDSNDQIIAQFSADIKHEEVEKRVQKEASERDQEEDLAAQLLKQI